MRQYLAIIKDSFRAAMASRVLYVLLALITILLLALAPFHFVETLDWKLVYQQHVKDPAALVEQLLDHKDDPGHPEVVRIWDQLPDRLKRDLEATEKSDDPSAKEEQTGSKMPDSVRQQQKTNKAFFLHQQVIEELNELIKDPDFYRAEDWKRMRLRKETKALVKSLENGFSAKRSRRLNRLLIGRAFRSGISRGQATSMSAWYGPWSFEMLDAPTTQAQFGAQVIAVIPGILDKFVLSIGLAVALLVTASIIPETFEPGSLNLLLSKPISRSGLFLSKFVGGCVFIALCATYLFVGIWLWLGLAMGVWENAILYCIVLYVIVFGIYYSVSAFVGLVTRSTILSVIVTILFWGSCFFVGTGYGFLNTRMQNIRIVGLNATEEANSEIVALNRLGQFLTPEGKNRPWQSLMPDFDEQAQMQLGVISYSANLDQSRELALPFGPVMNPPDGKMIAGNTSLLNPLSFTRQPMLMASGAGQPFQKQGKFPSGMMDLLQGKTMVVAVTSNGKIYRFQDPATADDRNTAAGKKRTPRKQYYVDVSPDQKIAIDARGQAAINRQSDDIAVYHEGTLQLLNFVEGKYLSGDSIELETGTPASMSCLVEFEGDSILLALGNGDVILVDANTLSETGRYRVESNYSVDSIAGTSDGHRFFLQTGNQRLWMLDTEAGEISRATVAGQGEISAVSVSGNDQLLVADRTARVIRYALPSFEVTDTQVPPDTLIVKIYRMVVRPLYRLWPKPGEFYKVVTYLSSSGSSETNRAVDLRQQPMYQNPFAPLTSGLAFMVVMLSISCVYFSRKDY